MSDTTQEVFMVAVVLLVAAVAFRMPMVAAGAAVMMLAGLIDIGLSVHREYRGGHRDKGPGAR